MPANISVQGFAEMPAVARRAGCVTQRSQVGAFQKHNLRVYHAAEGNRGLRLVRIST
jgi:hypothetical protein